MKYLFLAKKRFGQNLKIIPLSLLITACTQNPTENILFSDHLIAEDIGEEIISFENLITQKKTAKSSENISLIDAWQAAKAHAAIYQVAQYAQLAAQESQQQAKAHLLPQLSINAHYTNRAQHHDESHQSYGINLQIAQPIYEPSRWRKYQAEKITAQLGDTQLIQQKDALLLEVVKSYFEVLISQEKLSTIAKEKETYQAEIAQAEEKFKSGQATVLEILDAKSHYDAAVSREISIQTELITAQNTLEDYTGLSINHLIPVDNLDLSILKEIITEEYLLKKALVNNATLKHKTLELKKAIADKKITESEYHPKLSLTVGYQNDYNDTQFNNKKQNNSHKGSYIGLQFYLPIDSNNEIHSKIRQQNAYIQQKEAEYRVEKGKITLEIKQQIALLKGYQAQIEAQEQLYLTNLEKVKAAKLGNQYGMSHTLEIYQAEKDLSESKTNLLEYNYQYLLTIIRLLQLSGNVD